MPRPAYTNLSLKRNIAERLEEYARKYNISSASLVQMIVERLDVNIPLRDVLRVLESIPSLRFNSMLESEVLKVKCAQLYYHVDAMSSMVASLLEPSHVIDAKFIAIIKVWEKRDDVFGALRRAKLIDPSATYYDISSLIRESETVKSSLAKILDECWPKWRKEVAEPPLMREIRPTDDLLDMHVQPDTLRENLKPYVNEAAEIWKEANSLLYEVATYYPQLLELMRKCIGGFAKLFLITGEAGVVNN